MNQHTIESMIFDIKAMREANFDDDLIKRIYPAWLISTSIDTMRNLFEEVIPRWNLYAEQRTEAVYENARSLNQIAGEINKLDPSMDNAWSLELATAIEEIALAIDRTRGDDD